MNRKVSRVGRRARDLTQPRERLLLVGEQARLHFRLVEPEEEVAERARERRADEERRRREHLGGLGAGEQGARVARQTARPADVHEERQRLALEHGALMLELLLRIGARGLDAVGGFAAQDAVLLPVAPGAKRHLFGHTASYQANASPRPTKAVRCGACWKSV